MIWRILVPSTSAFGAIAGVSFAAVAVGTVLGATGFLPLNWPTKIVEVFQLALLAEIAHRLGDAS